MHGTLATMVGQGQQNPQPAGGSLQRVLPDQRFGLRRAGLAAAALVAVLIVAVAIQPPGTQTKVTVSLPDQHPGGVVVDERTGHAFVTSEGDGTAASHLTMLDASSGAVRRTVGLPLITSVALTLDSSAARVYILGTTATAGGSGLSIVDARDGTLLRTVALPWLARTMAVDTRHARVYVGMGSASAGASGSEGAIRVLDATTGGQVATFAVDGDPWQLAVDDHAHRLVAAAYVAVPRGGGFYNAMHLITLDSRNGRTIRDLSFGRVEIGGLALDAHAGRAVVLSADYFAFGGSAGPNPNTGTATIVDTTSGAVLQSTTLGGKPFGLTLDSHAGRIAVSEGGPSRLVTTLGISGGSGQAVSLVATGNGRVSILDVHSGRILRASGVNGVPSAVVPGTMPGQILAASFPLPELDGTPRGDGTLTLLDESTGHTSIVAQVPATVDARLLAVDHHARRAFLLQDGFTTPDADPWAWLPSWLRSRLPIPSSLPPRMHSVSAKVIMLSLPH